MSTADNVMASVSGKAGDDVIRANYGDPDGTMMRGGGGNDKMYGGKFDDIIVGGEGNDQMAGGAGADQFRFFLNEVSGTDTDYIYDLDFSEGDSLVFGNFAAGTFTDTADINDVNAYTNGTAATISSIEGIAALVNGSASGWTAVQKGTTDVLILSYTNGCVTQEIHISGAWDDYASLSTPV